MQQRLQVLLVGFVMASSAWSAALLERSPTDFYLVTVVNGQVHGQECGTFKPLLKDADAALAACQKHTGRKSFSVSLQFYEQAFQSLYGVPTPSLQEVSSIAELALEEERGARSEDSAEAGTRADVLARVLAAYDRIFDPILSGALQVKASDKNTYDQVVTAFWPVFSDGDLVIRLTNPVAGSEFKNACPVDWVPMSIAAASSIKRKAEFKAWLKHRLPTDNLMFWVGHYFMQAYTVEKSEAYAADSALFGLTVDDRFVSAAFPAPTIGNWNLPLKSIPSATAVLSNQNANTHLRALCFRRAYPDALKAVAAAPKEQTLEAVAKQFKQSDAAYFRRMALQFPEIDRGMAGLTLLLNAGPSARDVALIEPALKEFFKPELPTVEELQNIIKERKAKEVAEANAARELALAEQRRKNEAAAAERRRQAEEVNIGGVTYSSRAEFMRTHPGWTFDPRTNMWESPVRYVETSRSRRYYDDDDYTYTRSSSSTSRTTTTYEWPDGSYRSTKYRGPGYYYSSDR